MQSPSQGRFYRNACFQIAKERLSDGDIMEYFELVAQLYMIFDAIMQSYTVRSTIVWPLLLQDEEILRRLIAIVFVRITDILLYHMPQLTPEDTHFSREKFMQRKLQGTISMKTFFSYSKKFGLTEVMDPVLDDLWDINKEIQEYAYPELHLESFRKLESEKDGWRRLVEFAEKHPNEVSMQIPLGWSMNNKNL
jgi:hypothetical protein